MSNQVVDPKTITTKKQLHIFVAQTCQIKQVMILVVSFWNHQDGTVTCIDFFKLTAVGLKTGCHVEPKCSWLKHLQGCKKQINWLWNDVGRKPTIIPQKSSDQMKSPICRIVTPKVKTLLSFLSSWRIKGPCPRCSICLSQIRHKVDFWYVASLEREPTNRAAKEDL